MSNGQFSSFHYREGTKDLYSYKASWTAERDAVSWRAEITFEDKAWHQTGDIDLDGHPGFDAGAVVQAEVNVRIDNLPDS